MIWERFEKSHQMLASLRPSQGLLSNRQARPRGFKDSRRPQSSSPWRNIRICEIRVWIVWIISAERQKDDMSVKTELCQPYFISINDF